MTGGRESGTPEVRQAPGQWRRWIWPAPVREDRLFLLLAVIIGLFAGLLVVCFRVAIEWSRIWLLGSSLEPLWPRVVLVPAGVGLFVAVLLRWVFPLVRGSGVTQTKAALYIYDGFVPFSTVVGKFLTSALSIGGGFSLGPEDPSLQIGAGLASSIGRALRLSRDRLRLIAPIGAAAGLSAAFNSPISAVLFVIEEVIGRWSAAVLGAIVLAAVSSAVVARTFLGADPLFTVPAYRLVRPQELFAYAALGVAGGWASVLFVRLVAWLRPRVRQLPAWAGMLMPALAGLIVGTTGLFLPEVMGAGYEAIDQALHDQFTWRMLAVLAVAKIAMTAISFASGAPGGLFAPTLFMGAMVGGAVGALAAGQFPELTAPPGVYGLVGMGTLFAGVLRAPMTSVFMILEVSGSYSIILPVIISNTIAYVISRRWQRVPIFDMLTRQDGLELPSMEELREARELRVEDAMRPAGRALVESRDSLKVVLQKVGTDREHVLVRLDGGGWSTVPAAAIRAMAEEGLSELAVAEAVQLTPLPRLHPDHSLETVLMTIGDRPMLPVVHRTDPRRLEGVVSVADVLRAYREAVNVNGLSSGEARGAPAGQVSAEVPGSTDAPGVPGA